MLAKLMGDMLSQQRSKRTPHVLCRTAKDVSTDPEFGRFSTNLHPEFAAKPRDQMTERRSEFWNFNKQKFIVDSVCISHVIVSWSVRWESRKGSVLGPLERLWRLRFIFLLFSFGSTSRNVFNDVLLFPRFQIAQHDNSTHTHILKRGCESALRLRSIGNGASSNL